MYIIPCLHRAMVNNKGSKEEKIALLKKACHKHQQLYRDAMNGKGLDRHMFGLFVACRGLGYVSFWPVSDPWNQLSSHNGQVSLQESEFLKDSLMMPWTLSTSQQPQQQIASSPDCNAPAFQDKVLYFLSIFLFHDTTCVGCQLILFYFFLMIDICRFAQEEALVLFLTVVMASLICCLEIQRSSFTSRPNGHVNKPVPHNSPSTYLKVLLKWRLYFSQIRSKWKIHCTSDHTDSSMPYSMFVCLLQDLKYVLGTSMLLEYKWWIMPVKFDII